MRPAACIRGRQGRQLGKASMHDAASSHPLADIAMQWLAVGSLTLTYLTCSSFRTDRKGFSESGLIDELVLSCHTGLTDRVVVGAEINAHCTQQPDFIRL